MKKAAPVAEQSDQSEGYTGPGFTLESEVVIREKSRVPFTIDGENTIGQLLDQEVAQHAKHGGEMRSWSISFTEADWAVVKEGYKNWEPEDRFR